MSTSKIPGDELWTGKKIKTLSVTVKFERLADADEMDKQFDFDKLGKKE